MIISKNMLLRQFRSGAKPTQKDFENLIEAIFNEDRILRVVRRTCDAVAESPEADTFLKEKKEIEMLQADISKRLNQL